MRLTVYLLLLLVAMPGVSQDYTSDSKRAIRHFEEGKSHFLHKQDEAAEESLLKAIKKDPEFSEAWFMLAQIYLDQQQPAKAASHYAEGVLAHPDEFPNGYLKLAELLYKIGKYTDADEYFRTWKELGVRDTRLQSKAMTLEKNLTFAVNAVANPVPFEPKSLGDSVNTEQFEYWPSLSVDEQTLFFTVLGPPNPELPTGRLTEQEDFYFAEKQDGNWTNRHYLGAPVNTNTNEGAQSVTADGRYIYFTSCNRPDGHGRMCDLYFSSIDNEGRWSKPENLGDVINTRASEKHPAISADGRILYFTSNRPGGKGGYDIWMSVRHDGGWTRPVNLGDSINTPGMEQSPFIHPDQRSLYFSSDHWPGMGMGDIFLSRLKDDGTWSTPENLGYPINTHNEEVGFVVNAQGNRAYYSTNRREGTDTDIYTFEMPERSRPTPVSYITGRVYDAANIKGIEAMFQLIDLSSGELVMESASNPEEGNYFVSLPTGSSYAFNVSHPGYLFYSDHFEIARRYSRLEPFRKDIPLEPIRKGKSIVLNNIFFDFDSYTLKEESRIELNKITELLELNPGMKIEISGHTDQTGSSIYNMELSQKRAEEVVKYLATEGIDPERLTSKGYGDTKPLSTNETEEGRALNRRTELKVL